MRCNRSRRRSSRALLVAVLALAALPAGAGASTARIVTVSSCGGDIVCDKYAGGGPLPVVTYEAGAGEANGLTVSRAGDTVTLADSGAVIAPEPPCRRIDDHRATCPAGGARTPPGTGVPGLVVRLGDGPDTLAISGSLGTPTTLDGGDGNDVLGGSPEADTLIGGLGADTLDGGEGADRLTFAARADNVTVDVASGRTSDGDAFRRVESFVGGDGDDRLLGSNRAEALHGGAGNDTLRGRGGADVLSGWLGVDALDGGSGDDQLDGDPPESDAEYIPDRPLSRDVLRGGPGDDELVDAGGANTLVGGSGDDALEGGNGADRIAGGPGRDRLDGGPAPDRLSGGRGNDRLVGGFDDDRLAGGPGADTLRGDDDLADTLETGGADRLSGGAGPDRLDGGSGRDRLAGGAGRDELRARDGARDRVGCGSGRDRPGSTRKTACALAKPCAPVAILGGVDQAFPHSAAA